MGKTVLVGGVYYGVKVIWGHLVAGQRVRCFSRCEEGGKKVVRENTRSRETVIKRLSSVTALVKGTNHLHLLISLYNLLLQIKNVVYLVHAYFFQMRINYHPILVSIDLNMDIHLS